MGCNTSSQASTLQSANKAKTVEYEKPQKATEVKNEPIKVVDTIVNQSSSKPTATKSANQNKKHIMLSYQHGSQKLVLDFYEYLKKKRIRTWMDIKGGMGEHLLDSMAAAVNDSEALVCFLTQKYQDSRNCEAEFKYARKKDKPIIPCFIEHDWKPTGWLDIGIGDVLYIDFRKGTEGSYEPKFEELLNRIKQVAPSDSILMADDEDSNIAEKKDTEDLGEKPNYESVVNIDYRSKIPPAIHEGPAINNVDIDPDKLNKNTCEGDSMVRLMLTGKGDDRRVRANQDWFARDDKFINYFFIPKLIFHNTSKEPISIIEISGEYENFDGKWCECHSIKIGPSLSDGAEEYTWFPNTTLNLNPANLSTFAVRADIQIHGEPGGSNVHRMRAHRSLPQPLKIRLRLQDTEGKATSLIVEQVNEPFILPTKEILMKQFNYQDVIAFIYADDCEMELREWVTVWYEDKSKLRISFGNSTSFCETKYVDVWLIAKLCSEAKKAGLAEIAVTQFNNDQRIITALFDTNTFILYGFRIELKTKTSRTVETVLPSLDKIKERFAEEQQPESEGCISAVSYNN